MPPRRSDVTRRVWSKSVKLTIEVREPGFLTQAISVPPDTTNPSVRPSEGIGVTVNPSEGSAGSSVVVDGGRAVVTVVLGCGVRKEAVVDGGVALPLHAATSKTRATRAAVHRLIELRR